MASVLYKYFIDNERLKRYYMIFFSRKDKLYLLKSISKGLFSELARFKKIRRFNEFLTPKHQDDLTDAPITLK